MLNKLEVTPLYNKESLLILWQKKKLQTLKFAIFLKQNLYEKFNIHLNFNMHNWGKY